MKQSKLRTLTAFLKGLVRGKRKEAGGNGHLLELHPHHTDTGRQASAGHQPEGAHRGARCERA